MRERSGQRTCGSAAHGLIVRGCATQRVARREQRKRRAKRTAVRRLRPRVGPPLTLPSSNEARPYEPYYVVISLVCAPVVSRTMCVCGTALYARQAPDAFGEARTSARLTSWQAVAS